MASAANPPMTDDRPGQQPSSDPISAIVEAFAVKVADDDSVDLDAFCAEQPEAIRDEVRRRCGDALKIQRTLRSRLRSSTRPRTMPGGGLMPGTRLGEFTIESELGRGGMGSVVYLARQESLRRRVALKVLSLGPEVNERAIKRFHRAASAAARLAHPGIVQVHSVGETDGALYLAMEYIEGKTLAQHQRADLAAWPGARSGFLLGTRHHASRITQVAELMARMAEALSYAHGAGVIHRDVKPSNVIIDADGRPHICDFDLAKDLHAASISQSGDLSGTPYYMSPEQAMAKRVAIDHRTDVFSLGVVLYELLARTRPFEGDTLQSILHDISFREPTPLRQASPDVPRDLETICHKALEKRPDHRFASMADMAADLRHFLNHESITARPPSLPERARRALAKHRAAAALIALVLVLAATPFIADAWADHKARRQQVEQVADLAHGDLSGLPNAELVAARQQALRLLGSTDLSAGERRRVDDALALIHLHATERREAALRSMRAGLDPSARMDPGDPFGAFPKGFGDYVAAALLASEEEALELVAANALNPTVTVRALAADGTTLDGAQITLLTLDAHTGLVTHDQRLGPAPVKRHSLSPALYRLVARGEVGGIPVAGESTQLFETPLEARSVTIRLRAEDDVTADMVLIPGGAFIAGDPDEAPGVAPGAGNAIHTLPAFWIDRHEVSNAEYKAFVDATGRRPPSLWPVPYDDTLDDLPVVSVTHADTRAYAAWAGKRLPTGLEWERAARGTGGAAFPRPLTEVPLAAYVIGDPRGADFSSDPDQQDAFDRALYREAVVAVDARPETAGPEGLFHTLDNVREWTESPFWDEAVGRFLGGQHLVKGGGWWSMVNPVYTNLFARSPVPDSVFTRGLGFRCARSATL